MCHSLWTSIAVPLMFAQGLIELVIHLWGLSLIHILMDINRQVYSLTVWMRGGCVIYTFYVKLIKYVDTEYFDRLESIVRSSAMTLKSKDLVLQHKQNARFKQRVMQAFSFIPCLWFTFLFLSISVMYDELRSFFRKPESAWTDDFFQFLRITDLVYTIFIVVHVIETCESTANNMRDRTDDLIETITRTDRTMELQSFVSELNAGKTFQFTVCSMFDINRRLGLSFLSSLITFTVLFNQIASEWTSSKT